MFNMEILEIWNLEHVNLLVLNNTLLGKSKNIVYFLVAQFFFPSDKLMIIVKIVLHNFFYIYFKLRCSHNSSKYKHL